MKTKATEFIRKYGVNSSNIRSLTFLTDIAAAEHYKVYRPRNSNDTIVETMGLQEYFETHLSLSYSHQKSHYILIHALVSDGTAAEMLLHELAHIYLRHLDNAQLPSESDEAEADIFVSHILKEVYRSHSPNVLSVICAFISVMALTISLYNTDSYHKTAEPVNGTYILNAEDAQLESVFVSEFGHKYHKADCYHIRESEVVELTISEAEELGYEPCKDCY